MNDDLEEFCPDCERFNKSNPDRMINPYHHPLERCPYLPVPNKDNFKKALTRLQQQTGHEKPD